jgi:hypothetical protein
MFAWFRSQSPILLHRPPPLNTLEHGLGKQLFRRWDSYGGSLGRGRFLGITTPSRVFLSPFCLGRKCKWASRWRGSSNPVEPPPPPPAPALRQFPWNNVQSTESTESYVLSKAANREVASASILWSLPLSPSQKDQHRAGRVGAWVRGCVGASSDPMEIISSRTENSKGKHSVATR